MILQFVDSSVPLGSFESRPQNEDILYEKMAGKGSNRRQVEYLKRNKKS